MTAPKLIPWRPTFFRIQSRCLNILGRYFDEERNRGWNHIRSSINSYLSILLFLSQVYAVQSSKNDLRILCHILGLLVGIFLSVIKILALHYQVNDFVQLNHLLTELSATVIVPRDRRQLLRANKLGQTFSFLNLSCLLVSTLTLILYPLAETIYQFWIGDDPESLIWPTPFDSKVPFEASHSPVYELVYIFMLYNFIIACFSINATDSVFVEASVLLACHFKFLHKSIRELNYDKFDEEIRKVFAYHQAILTAKDSLQKAYSKILPFFVVIAPTMLGLFVISALRSPGVTVFKSLGYAISTLGQLFFYTYGGDIIHWESTSIVESFYNSNWYEACPKKREIIVKTMIMTQTGTRINAGLLELSLFTFGRILSSTFTLITVLQSVFD